MQKIFTGIIIFLAAVLQISFLPNFFPAGLAPDMVLILVIIWTVRSGFHGALARTVLAGLVLDLLSFWPVGFSALSFVTVSFAVDSLSKRFLVPQAVRKMIIFLALILAGSLVNYFALAVLTKIFISLKDLPQSDFSIWNRAIILKPLFNLIIFAMIYLPLGKFEQIFTRQNKVIIKALQ